MWYSKFALISTLLKSNVIFFMPTCLQFLFKFHRLLMTSKSPSAGCVCRPLQDVADISSGVSVSVRKRAT